MANYPSWRDAVDFLSDPILGKMPPPPRVSAPDPYNPYQAPPRPFQAYVPAARRPEDINGNATSIPTSSQGVPPSGTPSANPMGPSPAIPPAYPVPTPGAVVAMPPPPVPQTGVFMGGQPWQSGQTFHPPPPQMDPRSPEYAIYQSRQATGMPTDDLNVPMMPATTPPGSVTLHGQQPMVPQDANRVLDIQNQARNPAPFADKAVTGPERGKIDPNADNDAQLRRRAITDPHSIPPAQRKQVLASIQKDQDRLDQERKTLQAAEKPPVVSEKERMADKKNASLERIAAARDATQLKREDIRGLNAKDLQEMKTDDLVKVIGLKHFNDQERDLFKAGADIQKQKAAIDAKIAEAEKTKNFEMYKDLTILKLKQEFEANKEGVKSFEGKKPEVPGQPQVAQPQAPAQQAPAPVTVNTLAEYIQAYAAKHNGQQPPQNLIDAARAKGLQ